jgi:hypothetical protein
VSGPSPNRSSRIALGAAVALVAAGWGLSAVFEPVSKDPPPRVVLIRAPGLTWNLVANGIHDGRMTFLDEIVRDGAAVADLVTRDYRGEAELLASVVTGRFPFAHGVRTASGLARLGNPGGEGPRAFWVRLAERGADVAVLGFPPGAVARGEPGDVLLSDAGRSLYLDLGRTAPGRIGVEEGAEGLEELDGLLRRLTGAAGDNTTFLLVSDGSARQGAGLFVAWGRGVRRTTEPLDVAPVDLAATFFYLTGYPLPQDLDGVVLLDVLDESYAVRHRRVFRP